MLTEQEMLKIAEQYISFNNYNDIELTIYHELTIKKPYGNIYKYDSKLFAETREFKYHILGSAPFLVEKETGRVVGFGTARKLKFYLDAYENGTLEPSLDLYWYPDEEKYDFK